MTSSAPDPALALERSYLELHDIAAAMTPAQWEAPTNCPSWDARALVNHIMGGALMYALANDGTPSAEDHGDVLGDDPVEAIRATAATNLASWREPGALDGDRVYPWGTFPAAVGLLINLGEVAVHTWDLAMAVGQPATIDPVAAALVFELYRDYPMDAMRAAGIFGPEVPVPEGAPVDQRLLGLMSRKP